VQKTDIAEEVLEQSKPVIAKLTDAIDHKPYPVVLWSLAVTFYAVLADNYGDPWAGEIFAQAVRAIAEEDRRRNDKTRR
jgi:hypothetical protein